MENKDFKLPNADWMKDLPKYEISKDNGYFTDSNPFGDSTYQDMVEEEIQRLMDKND